MESTGGDTPIPASSGVYELGSGAQFDADGNQINPETEFIVTEEAEVRRWSGQGAKGLQQARTNYLDLAPRTDGVVGF